MGLKSGEYGPWEVVGMGTQMSGVRVKNGAGESFVVSLVLGGWNSAGGGLGIKIRCSHFVVICIVGCSHFVVRTDFFPSGL